MMYCFPHVVDHQLATPTHYLHVVGIDNQPSITHYLKVLADYSLKKIMLKTFTSLFLLTVSPAALICAVLCLCWT